jgi:hypothetical protein
MKNNLPVIKTGHALKSLRDSGYSIEAALGEVIDNSIEAKANVINIHLIDGKNKEYKKCVKEIVVIDDGQGMSPELLQYYPQVGFSTRYMRTDTIGKYGVGAKLAALNFAKRFDVWSRTSENGKWYHTYFDLDETLKKEEKGEELMLAVPVLKRLPSHIFKLTDNTSRTIVNWTKIDRLEDGRYTENFDQLRVHIEKEISRIFRYFLDGGISIRLNKSILLPFDPLFLMNDTYNDLILRKYYKKKEDNKFQNHYHARIIAEEKVTLGINDAVLKITLYPKEVLRKRGLGGDVLAKKLRINDSQGIISFVRNYREVSYTNVPRIFPTGVQPPDRFIGIEVSFLPKMDESFGVRNVKRGVEPHGELRKKIRNLLKKYIPQARKLINDAWSVAAAEDKIKFGEHNAITNAVKTANKTLTNGPVKDVSEEEEKTALEELALDVVGNNQDEKKQYLSQIKDAPFIIESVSFPGNQFIDITHLSHQIIIKINTRHRFYKEVWEPIKSLSELDAGNVTGEEALKIVKRTDEALSLLIVAYAKAESMSTNPIDEYSDLTNHWGHFMNSLLGKIKNII